MNKSIDDSLKYFLADTEESIAQLLTAPRTEIEPLTREQIMASFDYPIIVKRVDNLDSKYNADLALLEGGHRSLENFESQVVHMTDYFNWIVCPELFSLIQEYTGKMISSNLHSDAIIYSAAQGHEPITLDEVRAALQSKNMPYLENDLIMEGSCIYDTLSTEDDRKWVKIADILEKA